MNRDYLDNAHLDREYFEKYHSDKDHLIRQNLTEQDLAEQNLNQNELSEPNVEERNLSQKDLNEQNLVIQDLSWQDSVHNDAIQQEKAKEAEARKNEYQKTLKRKNKLRKRLGRESLDLEKPSRETPNRENELSGLLLLDKESGPTGHTGTLDPLATGLMGMLLGPSTKLEPWLVKMSKLYRAEIRLGLRTDTDDVTGKEIRAHLGPYPKAEEIEAALEGMLGTVPQVPPAYSAIKVGGKTAHKAARAGRPLELDPRSVIATELKLISWNEPFAVIEAQVSTGYYVRSLARDLGEALGLGGGALSALRRLKVGDFDLSMAIPMPDSREGLKAALISPRDALRHLPEVFLGPEEMTRLVSGAFVPFPAGDVDQLSEGPFKIIGHGGRLFALAEPVRQDESGSQSPQRPFLRPLRVFGPFPAPRQTP